MAKKTENGIESTASEAAGIGHNSLGAAELSGDGQAAVGKELLSFVERLEKLKTEKADIASLEKEVRDEAKGRGFNIKIINQIIRDRARDESEMDEEEVLYSTYWSAIHKAANDLGV